MRATIHLVSSRDFLAFRPLIQPRLEREVYQNQTFGRHRLEGLDMDAVLAAGIARMTESPAIAAQLRDHLAPPYPDRDPAAPSARGPLSPPHHPKPAQRTPDQVWPTNPHDREPLAPQHPPTTRPRLWRR
ncbi:DNA glycosylase AlkZ-like family protein [Kribbella sindirgiensis]